MCLCITEEEDVPAVLHRTVQLAGGEVAVERKIKGGVTGHIGHAAETEGIKSALLFRNRTTMCIVYLNLNKIDLL